MALRREVCGLLRRSMVKEAFVMEALVQVRPQTERGTPTQALGRRLRKDCGPRLANKRGDTRLVGQAIRSQLVSPHLRIEPMDGDGLCKYALNAEGRYACRFMALWPAAISWLHATIHMTLWVCKPFFLRKCKV